MCFFSFMLFGLFLEGDSKSHNLCLFRWSILALNSLSIRVGSGFSPSSHPHSVSFSFSPLLTSPPPLFFWALVACVTAVVVLVKFICCRAHYQSSLCHATLSRKHPEWAPLRSLPCGSGEEQIWQLILHICKHVWSTSVVLKVVESNVATNAMSPTPPCNPFLHLTLQQATGQVSRHWLHLLHLGCLAFFSSPKWSCKFHVAGRVTDWEMGASKWEIRWGPATIKLYNGLSNQHWATLPVVTFSLEWLILHE